MYGNLVGVYTIICRTPLPKGDEFNGSVFTLHLSSHLDFV